MSEDTYVLVRRNPNGTLDSIRFNGGIVAKMKITEDEWKPLGNIEEAVGHKPSPSTQSDWRTQV